MSPDPSAIELGPDREGLRVIAHDDTVTYFGHGGDDAPERAVDWRGACPEAEINAGLVNAHTHIYSGLAPLGMPEAEPPPENFVQILERVWWRLDRALDEPSLRASARYYAAEALLAGTTTLIDHHESPNLIDGSLDILADACQELGIRAVLCYGATERNGGRDEARRGLAECRRFLETNTRPLVRGLVGLHASFTVSDDTIAEAAELCRDHDTVMHVHVAEDGADVDDARERGYDGPLERLLAFDALPAGSILAHCVHCNHGQVKTAASRRLWIVQNPRSNHGNRVGYPAALGASDLVALGTDGYPARMREESGFLATQGRRHDEDVAKVFGRVVGGFELVAERFGVNFAPLAAGCAADAAAFGNEAAQHVLVGGRPVVVDGRLTTADIEEIRAEAAEQAPLLWQRMAAL